MRHSLRLVLVALAVAAGFGAFREVVAGQATAPPDVLSQLLSEVRGLREAMEQMASSGPRVQLALGRLQLQEQRVNTLLRRLDEVRTTLQGTVREQEEHQVQLKQFEEGKDRVEEAGERQAVEQQIAQLREMVRRGTADVQRLQGEDASLSAEIAAEQSRWTTINQQLEELERSLARR